MWIRIWPQYCVLWIAWIYLWTRVHSLLLLTVKTRESIFVKSTREVPKEPSAEAWFVICFASRTFWRRLLAVWCFGISLFNGIQQMLHTSAWHFLKVVTHINLFNYSKTTLCWSSWLCSQRDVYFRVHHPRERSMERPASFLVFPASPRQPWEVRRKLGRAQSDQPLVQVQRGLQQDPSHQDW